MLAVDVTVVEVIDVVAVQDSLVSTAWAVRVLVAFGLAVLGGRHESGSSRVGRRLLDMLICESRYVKGLP
ncbi:MAG: hypothetical protein ACR2FQ_01680 [Pseudonocardiaceae bacterium]